MKKNSPKLLDVTGDRWHYPLQVKEHAQSPFVVLMDFVGVLVSSLCIASLFVMYKTLEVDLWVLKTDSFILL